MSEEFKRHQCFGCMNTLSMCTCARGEQRTLSESRRSRGLDDGKSYHVIAANRLQEVENPEQEDE